MSGTPSATATQISKKAIRRKEARDSKVVENPKKCMFVKGPKTSGILNDLLNDLASLKKPYSIKYQRKNQIRPFEDDTSLEFFGRKNDASQFIFASHTKKRPHSLTFGRMFNFHLLDMVEFGISNYKGLASFTEVKAKPMMGSKPAVIFQGQEWESSEDYKRMGNVFLDVFHLHQVSKIDLSGLDHVIICTTLNGVILFRQYMIKLLKSGTKIPRVELMEVGPSFDCTLRRSKFASSDLMKEAQRIPPQLIQKKKKNHTRNALGDELITVHMQSQDLSTMPLARQKGRRKNLRPAATGESPAKKQKVAEAE